MLDPSADEIRDWGNSVIQLMSDYLGSLRDRGVYRHMFSRRIRDRLDATLPTKGTDFDALLRVFREDIIPFSRQNAHPRMFGYVQSPGTPIAAFADLLASTLNANLTVWRSAPAPVEVERLTIDWIRQILGFNAEAGGLFVSGGSMANLAAIAAARQAKDSSSDRLRMYASSETHFSIAKAAALLGIGRQNVRHVAVDEHFRIRVDDLISKITVDLEAGYVPFCVIAHADSIALDPHKWLYLPVDVGCVIYRSPEIARAAFAHDAEYTRIIGEEADEAFAFWDYGPELSRRFRALKVWMLLKGVGLESLSEAIESNLASARYLESIVRASDDFEMIAPVDLSIFCFRHVPAELRRESPEAIDAFNERLLIALQRDGSSYLSNATLGGRFALRGCILNYRTTLEDMEILLDDLRRVATSLLSSA